MKKDDLHEAVNSFFREPVLEKALLDNLKASSVQYERALKYGGKRGFFTGVKFKLDEQVSAPAAMPHATSGLSDVLSSVLVMASDDQSQVSDITDAMSL